MRDWIKLIMVITFSLVLAACGGDGLGTSNSTGQDTTVPDPDPDVPVPTSNATNITLEVSSRQMPSDGSNTVTLTAVARDNSNRYVENTTIEFSASSGGILPGERTITNSSGRVSATLDVGGDPANRTITVTAVDSVTGQSASQLVEVRDT
ncbi:MAG: Ig-like domain-containing protein, partial [Gammaproteobacteria bacterium]|nr:Ig-like domain-containing protein [Gammaproteobacteria bacterium]